MIYQSDMKKDPMAVKPVKKDASLRSESCRNNRSLFLQWPGCCCHCIVHIILESTQFIVKYLNIIRINVNGILKGS